MDRIFGNLVGIRDFSKKFSNQLNSTIDPNNPYNKFAHVFLDYAEEFKIFYPYAANYAQSEKLIESLLKTRNRFKSFIDSIEFTPALKQADIFSFLIKPVQRLTKYPILLKDLVKHTDKQHPDFQDIQTALALTIRLNEENHQSIKQYIKNMKLAELQELYGEELKIRIYHPERKFIAEETVQLAEEDNNSQLLKLYIMSDLVIYAEQLNCECHKVKPRYQTEIETSVTCSVFAARPKTIASALLFHKHKAKHIVLNDLSIIKDISDAKYFSNLFCIAGENRAQTFCTRTASTKEKLLQILVGIVSDLKYSNLPLSKVISQASGECTVDSLSQKQVEVHVLGSEDRSNGFKSHTYYIVLVTYRSKNQKCFKKHSDFQDLSKTLKANFPQKRIEVLQKKINFIKSHRSKTIEMRKLAIENFLQRVLQDVELRESCFIARFFKFEDDFFQGKDEEKEDQRYSNFFVTPQTTIISTLR